MNVYVRETATALASSGIAVDVFTRSREDRPEIIEMSNRVRLIALPIGLSGANKEALHGAVGAFVERTIKYAANERRGYDAVLSHYWLSGLAGNQLSRKWRVPHVASFHTVALAKQQAYCNEAAAPERINGERQVAAEAQRIIAAGEHERDMLIEHCAADPNKITIAEPGVDHARFRPLDQSDCRRLLGLANDRRYLVTVGRTTPLKGFEVLLDALSTMEPGDRPTLLVIGGEKGSAEVRRLESVAQELGLAGRVLFTGSVSHDELPLYYGAADICVVPSHYESYGMVASEAQACGRPVVASNVGGLASVVKNGVTGLLVPPGSPDNLGRALQTLLGRPALAQTLGAAGVQAARERTWKATADGIVAAICRCASQLEPVEPVVP